MQTGDEIQQPCTLCKRRPAIHQYARATMSALVCECCWDRMAVQDALEDRLAHIVELEAQNQYEAAFKCLDAIWEANKHRDNEGWLARSIAMHRCSALLDAGRYAEAEQAAQEWARLGFQDAWHRCLHASTTAEILEILGRPEEAIGVLEDALGYRDPTFISSALTVLEDLANLSESLGKSVDVKWRNLVEEVAAFHGIDMPANTSLGRAIVTLAEIDRAQQSDEEDEGAE